MSLGEFKNILRFAREPSADEKRELFKEAALMTLARATSADTNIKTVEVKLVQELLIRITDEEISLADIKTAAQSELFERQPLDRYLVAVGRKLDKDQRITLLGCLAEVIKGDERVSHYETDYFDMVATALNATPSELAGLVEK